LAKKPKKRSIVLIPVELPRVKIGQDLDEVVIGVLNKHGLKLTGGDVVAVASKVVSTCESRIRNLDRVKVTEESKRASRKWHLDARLASIVLRESDQILGGVNGFLLTVRDGVLAANAGVDLKNCPPGNAMLLPSDSDASAARLRRSLERHYGVRLAVIVVDSRVTPLRLGTVGLAVGVSGLEPVVDFRGSSDIYSREVRVTQTNVADDLASSAHLLMGEADERVGLVVAKRTSVKLRRVGNSRRALLKAASCLVMSNLAAANRRGATEGVK
jgi:coenzyme F420-0:L-glutamate ligase/coenzyme F420-1:gamma-L-glutamate ligase